MFSIRKKHKIQVLHYHNPSQSEIIENIQHSNDVSSAVCDHLKNIFKTKIDELTNQKPLEEELELSGIRALRDFFLQFPSAWEELKRKISAHKEENPNDKRLYIPKEKEEQIFAVLLRLGRKEGIWDNLEEIFRSEILSNPSLLGRSSREPSILDSSHGNLAFLDTRKRTDFIEHIIQHGIQKNSDQQNIDFDHFIREVFPVIQKYLQSIFDIEFTDIGKIHTIKQLSRYIDKKIWNEEKNGLNSKKAWMLVKAFSAWGGYPEIEALRHKTEGDVIRTQEVLKSYGIELGNTEIKNETLTNGEELKIYQYQKAQIHLKSGLTVTCKVEFRVKSLRSILLKLWESEDYNNIDALRDIFGMAIVFDDTTENSIKEEVILKMSELMIHKGYILKNKGFLNEGSLKNLKKGLKNTPKKPLGKIVSAKKAKSSPLLTNASISGFSSIFGDSIGMEIQFYDNKGYEYWKVDHYKFDPLKVVSAWGRGSWFITPKQLLHTIRKEIPEHVREDILKKRSQEIILEYLHDKRLYAFKSYQGGIYFTSAGHYDKFHQKLPNMTAIDLRDDSFKYFIKNLSTSDSSKS